MPKFARLFVPIFVSFHLASHPGTLFAQHAQGEANDRWVVSTWMGDLAFLGINAMGSGLSAGVFQWRRGGSFHDGFTRGALGGSIHYAGKRTSALRFDGAGLIGRQISAVGVAAVRNAAEAEPMFDRLFLPVGPVRVHVDRTGPQRMLLKLDAPAVITGAAAAFRPELEFDARASLSAGAFVFRTPNHRMLLYGKAIAGTALPGTAIIGRTSDPAWDRLVFAHERVHILQNDWHYYVGSDPVERWILHRIPGGRALTRRVDVGVVSLLAQTAFYGLLGIDRSYQLHEIEAEFLDSR